jgi:hypothetical protein
MVKGFLNLRFELRGLIDVMEEFDCIGLAYFLSNAKTSLIIRSSAFD